MADLYKDFEEAGLAVRSKGQGKGYTPGDVYRQMTGRDYAPGDYTAFAPGNATALTSPTPRRTAIGQPTQQPNSPEYEAYLQSLTAPVPEPEPVQQERGFFGNLGNLAIEGGKSTIRSAQVAPAVISGTEVIEKAGLISEELNKPRTDRPAELQEIDAAFQPVGEQWKQAEGFGQSAAAIGNMLLTVGKQAVTNPKGLAYMTSEQLANMAPSLAGVLVGSKAGALTGTAFLPGYGTAAGAVVGGVAGGFAGGAPVEIGSEFISLVGKAINEMGVPPTEANVRALLADEKFLNTALSEARIKGATTAGIDAAMTVASGGVATAPRRAALKTATSELGAGATAAQITKRADDILASRSVASKVGTGAAAVGVETAGGGLSEAGGQYAAYGEVDLADVGKEMLGELGGSALSVPAGAKAVMEGSRPRPDPRTVTERSGNVEITYPVNEQPQGELSREQVLEQRVNELESVVSQYLAPQTQQPLDTPAPTPVETVAQTRAERQLEVQRQIDAENNPRVDQPVTARIAPDSDFSAPPALAPIREPRGALNPERTRRTIDAASVQPSAFDRQMVMEQGGLSRPQEDTGARFVDIRPMAPREAQLRLTVLRDQFAQRGGDATGLTIVQHPTAANKFAIELRSNALPDLNLNTPIDPAVAQNRIESAALAGQVDARRQEDSARQVVINRAMRNIEERGGVASPAEARLLQEANLGQPYDRVDPSLAPEQTVDERLTAATGIELVGQPRESVRTTPQREAMNEVGAAELQARREANQAGAEARTQAAIEQTSRAPAAPDAAAVVEALKVAPVLRTAEQTAAIKQARARLAPNDFGILQKQAQAPVQMTNADKTRLNELLNPAPETTETAETPAAGRLAQEPQGKILTSDAKLSTKRAPVPGSTIKLNDEGTDHDIKIVPASKLGAKGRLLQQIARIFGKRLVTFESDTLQADGFVLSGNNENIYVNANSDINPLAVFGHELLHQLRRDNPQAYLALEAVIRRNVKESPEMDAEYGGYNADSRVEEVTADLVGNRFTDPDFWNDVFSEIRDLYPDQSQGIISRLTDALVKAIAAFRNAVTQSNYRADEFVNNLDEITKAIKDTFVEYTQAQKPVAQEVDARAEDAATAAPEAPQGTPTFADTREPAVTTETPQTPVIPDAVNDPSAKDETIQFSLRRKPDPKNTVKAYKLFRVDAKKPGQLFPLFVNANDPVEIGQWLDADIGEQTAGGKVKSKLGPLAFRPGWHAGDLPIATHIGAKSDNTLTAPDTRPDNHVWAEVEMAADRDWQAEANARARRNKDGEIILNTAHITDRIPEDGFYRYKTNANMTGNWLIGGSMKVNRVLSDAEVEQINLAAGTADLPRAKPFDAAKYGFDSTPAKPAEPANTEATPAADTNAGVAQERPQDGMTASRSRQVDTPEFKRWFGDSKVVDENGEPLVVYHGSPDIRFMKTDATFKSEKDRLGFGRADGAYWFTTSQATAKTYADPRRAFDYQNAEEGVIPAYLSLTSPLIVDGKGANWRDAQRRGKTSDVIAEAKAAGHDGVIIRNVKDNYNNDAKTKSTDTYVVFSSEQIKSATVNNGNFDPANPDITQSRRRQVDTPEFKRWSRGAPLVAADNALNYDFRTGKPFVAESYHGTNAAEDFREFSEDALGAQTAADSAGMGFFSTNEPVVAGTYAENIGFGRYLGLAFNGVPDLKNDPEANRLQARVDAAKKATSQAYYDAVSEAAASLGALGRPDNPELNRKLAISLLDILPGAEARKARMDAATDAMLAAEKDLSTYIFEREAAKLPQRIMPLYVRMENPKVYDAKGQTPAEFPLSDRIADAKKAGHDGVVFKNIADPSPVAVHYVSFKNTDIKSATGNDGQFAEVADITQSRRRPQVGKNIFGDIVESGWEVSDVNTKDTIVRALQDKMVDTKRVIQAITEKVGDISDKFDAYLQEELFYGRTATRVKDFNTQEVKPLMEEMSRLGVQPSELEEYLHNRHAEVRNERMKERGYKGDDASGISTADARAYLANLDPIKRKQLDSLASRVDDITKKTRDLMVEYGLETRDSMNAWEREFPYYVPLFRKESDFSPRSSNMGTGSGFGVSGGSSKKAKGSSAEVADILANIFQQRERAVIRGEKSRVGAALFGLALTNPKPDFWLAVKPDAWATDPDLDDKLRNMGLDPADARNLMQAPEGMRDYAVGVRINGQDHFVFFNNNNERANEMVRALKNMDADQLGRVMSEFGKVTRYMANVNTQYNPIFGVVNLSRDVQGAALNLTTTGIADKKSQVLSDTLPAIKGIYGALRAERAGKPEPTNEWSQLWRKFIDLGGQTGYRDQYSSAQQRAEAFAREMKRVEEGKPMKSARAIFDWLSDYNETLENGVRLAAFKAALDKGMSEQRAASIAKNLTVNFNRKGTWAVQAGALYAFFNAAVQGTARIYQTLTGPAGKKIIAGGLALGAIQALALSMAGFEEDEPPDFIKERNLIIPLGFFGDDLKTKYVTIPMPLGYNVIPNFSRVLTEWWMNDFKDPAKRVLQISGSFLEAFNPIGNAGWSVQTLTPSFMDPIVALSENRDFTGKPIYKENMSDLDPTPGYLRARDTSNVFTKAISKFLNEVSGGTEFKPGAIDWTPDAIEYLIGQATGGVGREVNKIGNMIVNAESGDKTEPYKVPLAGRFYGDTDTPGTVSSRFYNNVTELNKHWNEIQGRAKAGQNVNQYIQENPEAALSQSVSTYMKTVGDLKKEVTRLKESGASKDAIKYYENRITELMNDLNTRVKQFK